MVMPSDAEKTLSRGTALLNALRAKTSALPKPRAGAPPARVVPCSAPVATEQRPATEMQECGRHDTCVTLDDGMDTTAYHVPPAKHLNGQTAPNSARASPLAASSAGAVPRAAAISVKARVFASRPQLAQADDSEFVPIAAEGESSKKRRLHEIHSTPTAESKACGQAPTSFRSLEKAPEIALGNGAAVHRRGGRAAAAVAAAYAMEWSDRTAEEQMLSLVQLKWPDQLPNEETFMRDLLVPSLWSAPKPSIGHQIMRIIGEKKIGAKRLFRWCLVASSVSGRAKQDHERARAC